jgi:hypothetical protein
MAFRFDADLHEYFDLETGDIVPHITGLLESAGLIDTTWYTEEASERGTFIHNLTADWELGALHDTGEAGGDYRGYFLAYVLAMKTIRHKWEKVEVPHVHPRLRFGGRPDRVGRVFGARAVMELKTGPPNASHEIQTALQAILEEQHHKLPAEYQERYALYVKDTGKFRLVRHENKHDVTKAREIIGKFCRLAA